MGLLDKLKNFLGYVAPQRNVFTNRVNPQLQAKFYAEQEDPRQAFRQGLQQPVRQIGQAIATPFIRAGQGFATPYINKVQQQIDLQNEQVRQHVLKRARQEADAVKRKKLFDLAKQTNSPVVLNEAAPMVADPNYFRNVGKDILNVASVGIPALRVPGVIAKAPPLIRLAGSGVVRGAENMAFEGARQAIDQDFNPEALGKAGLLGALLNTALSPKLLGRGLRDLPGDIQATRAATQAVGRPGFAPGFAKVPGGQKPLGKDEVILYHRTSKAHADEIARTGKLLSKESTGEIFLSNKKAGQNVGYGDTVVPIRVKKGDVRLDDQFPSGEKHFAIKAEKALPDLYDEAKGAKGTGEILARIQQTLRSPARPVVVGRGPSVSSPTANPSARSMSNPKALTSGDILPQKSDLSLAEIQTKASVEKKPTLKGTWDTFKQQFLNRFDPIEQLAKGKNVAPSKNPATLLKRLSGGMGIANSKIDNELSPILKQVDDLDDFRSLLIAERLNEKSAQGLGKSANVALGELRAKVGDQQFTKYQQLAEGTRQFQNKLLKEWKDVGGLSDESYNAIVASNQKYTPLNRIMDDLEADGFVAGMSNINQKSQVIKKFKGSDRDIIDPLESMLKNTYEMTKAIEKNRAVSALARLGEFRPIKGVGGLVEPKTPHITFFENGKKVYYEAPKEIADAIKGINEEHLNLAVQAMALPARLMRAGATGLNVGFAVPNLIRDQLSAAVNSKYGGIPIYDFFSGLMSVIKKDDLYQKWLLSGADQASFFAQDRSTIQRTLGEVTRTKINKSKFLNPLELARIVGEFSEKGSRVGTFKRAFRGAGKEGLSGFDQELAAMVQSREATVDFARRGSKMKALNAMIPFLNARTQGALKLIESARKRPLQTGALGMALATIPATALYMHNKQYSDYDEIPDYIKDNNFIIMTGNPEMPFYKIPKGEIGQIFANPMENLLDFAYHKDRKSFLAMTGQILASLSPVQGVGDIIPTAVKVPLESIANYDTFRQRNIVSPYQKDLPPELQFDKKTSETAKWLGGVLKKSPAKIEHLIRGFTAGVGGQALMATDYVGFGKTPPKPNYPVVDRFLGESNDLSKSAQKIYEDEDKRKQETARNNYAIKQRIRKGIETNNLDLLREAQQANPESFKRFVNDVLEEKESANLSPKDRAIRALPKKEQERLGLKLLPTTGQPTAQAAEGDVSEFLASLNSSKPKSKTKLLGPLKLTGNATVDKANIKKRRSEITTEINNLSKMALEGHVPVGDIEREINKLWDEYNSYSAKKASSKKGISKRISRAKQPKSVKAKAPRVIRISRGSTTLKGGSTASKPASFKIGKRKIAGLKLKKASLKIKAPSKKGSGLKAIRTRRIKIRR